MVNHTFNKHTIGTTIRYVSLFTFLIIALAPKYVEAWQVVSAYRITEGAVALSDGPGGFWTVYEGEEDGNIRIIDADNGELVESVDSPEDVCNGLSIIGGTIWYAGLENIYLLDDEGRVRSQIEAPYEVMHGLVMVDGGLWTMALDSGVYYLTYFEPGGEETTRFRTNLHNPIGISWDGSFLWVTDRVDGFLHVFNPESEQEIDLYPTPFSQPTGIAHIDDQIILIDNGDEEDTDLLYQIDSAGDDAPRLLPFSRNYNFGHRVLNSPIERDFPLFNIGNEDLIIESIELTGGNNRFVIGRLPDNMRIIPGRSLIVPIIFNPVIYENYYDTLIVISNDPNEPEMRIILSGLGIFASRRLGVYPEVVDFGSVRADPWRDGIRNIDFAIFNKGGDEMRVEALQHNIQEIFNLEYDDMPQRLQAAETLWVNISFEPHASITYLDSIRVFSNDVIRGVHVFFMRGTGNDSVYAPGSVLWTHELEDGDGAVGGISILPDLNNDQIDEIVAVGPTGIAYCISGFASGVADIFWEQNFGNNVYAPVDLEQTGVIFSNSDLNGDGRADVIIGSGEEDRSVYAIDGRSGVILWRWDARTVGAEGAIKVVESSNDYNGDSANDPVILIGTENDETRRLVRLNGANGRPVWVVNPGEATTIDPLEDFDRDGVIDYFTSGNDDMIRIFSGVDGGLMEEIDSPTGGQLIVVEDLNDDSLLDVIFGDNNGILTAWSIGNEGEIWSVEQMGGVQLNGPIGNLHTINNDINEDGIGDVVATDGSELILCFDPVSGENIWVTQVNELVLMIPIADTDLDSIKDIAVGLENGSIHCLSGRDGSELWEYRGEDGSIVVDMIAFDDVDLGGTDEIVALFSDRTVRCISTGGDLVSVRDNEFNIHPSSSALMTLYPNPFNSTTRIGFSLTESTNLALSIWDSNGRLVNKKVLGYLQSGAHQYLFTDFSSANISAGLYYFEIMGKNERSIKSGILLK